VLGRHDMPSIFNPYVMLGALLLLLSMFGTGVSIGYKWSERKHVAAFSAAQDKAIADANIAVELAIQRTLASTKKETAARLAAREARHKGELDAAKKSRPECARDDVSMGLLNNAINSANGEEKPTSKLPDEVRPATETGGWIGTFGEKLGIRPDRSGGGVSSPSR